MTVINVQEATQILRASGMRISPDNVRLGIEQGVFPFGDLVRSKTGDPSYYVYLTLLNKWIAEREDDGVAL